MIERKLLFKCLLLSGLLILSGCSHRNAFPELTASGYLSDTAAVRVWRKDTQHISHIFTISREIEQHTVQETHYVWNSDQLVSFERTIPGKEKASLRFSQNGLLVFMERQIQGRREPIDPEQIKRYQFEAQQVRETSAALRVGKVILRQGAWLGMGKVRTCEGQIVELPVDQRPERQLLSDQTSALLSVAWLETTQEKQLLLVEQEDICLKAPKADNF